MALQSTLNAIILVRNRGLGGGPDVTSNREHGDSVVRIFNAGKVVRN